MSKKLNTVVFQFESEEIYFLDEVNRVENEGAKKIVF